MLTNGMSISYKTVKRNQTGNRREEREDGEERHTCRYCDDPIFGDAVENPPSHIKPTPGRDLGRRVSLPAARVVAFVRCGFVSRVLMTTGIRAALLMSTILTLHKRL